MSEKLWSLFVELFTESDGRLAAFIMAYVALKICRRNKYLLELLQRNNERLISSNNETWKIAFKAFADARPPSLEDLVARTERDWSIKR